MADDFVQRLRMNSIFPSQGFNPLMNFQQQAPNYDSMARLANSFIQNRFDRERIQEDNLHRRDRGEHLQDIARQVAQGTQPVGTPGRLNVGGPQGPMGANGKPMNVVIGQDPNQMTAYQKAMIARDNAKLAQTGDIAAGKLDVSKEGMDIRRGDQGIRQQRANVYEWKSQHPNQKVEIGNDGQFYSFNPATGNMEATGIDSLKMSDEEKQVMIGNQAMARTNVQQQGANSRVAAQQSGATSRNNASIQGRSDLASDVHGYRLSEDINRGAEQRQTNAAKPQRQLLPTQERAQQVNNARQLIATQPELEDFIQFDDAGNVTGIESPGTNSWNGKPTGPSPETYRQMLDFIYRNQPPPRPGSNQPAATTQSAAPTSGGQGPMIMVDGQPMSIEDYNASQQGTGARPGSTARPAVRSNYRVTVE